MPEFFCLGALLGLSAGLAPGPLLTLVITETIKHDIRAGARVAVSPFFTDLPIIVFTLFVLSRLAGSTTALGIISLVGGAVLLFMGYEGITIKPRISEHTERKSNSLGRGILVNILNPHPYFFWLGAGGSILSRSMNFGLKGVMAFICSFYIMLIGSKLLVAVLAGKTKSFLNGGIYLYTMRFLGMALCVLAFFLFRDGIRMLRGINF